MLSLLCVLMVQCADTGELATRVETLEFHVGRLQAITVPADLQEEKTARLARLRKSLAAGAEESAPVPLPRAHAHNDYRHERPLLDALRHGFCSVEADVFLVDDKLLVGHGRAELRPERTLEALYLEPLKERVRANGGRVYPGGPEFTLLIDVKSEAKATYRVLSRVLAGYAEMLTRGRDGQVTQGAVTAIVSGNRAKSLIEADSPRYAAIDGRLADLASTKPAALVPLISDNWNNHFRWRGHGPMPEAERRKLGAITAQAHQAGRRVRFWATPEAASVWAELHAAGVDLINTDDLPGLREFLLEKLP